MIPGAASWKDAATCPEGALFEAQIKELVVKTTPEHDERVANLIFAKVFPLLVAKVEKKGRTRAELLEVIHWLTGFDEEAVQRHIDQQSTYEQFFQDARINPNAKLITGAICGYRVEEIENVLTRKARYLDKLVDELAKGRSMEKILRKA